MNISVIYLGPARDWADRDTEPFDLAEGTRVGALIDRVLERHEQLASRRRVLRFAVNEEFADEHTVLSDGDRVAVIPPVSGGTGDDWIAIVEQPIDAAAVRRHVGGDPSAGGVAIFEGVTRLERHGEHGPLVRLDYEAYGDMALDQMRKLSAAARARWDVRRIAVVHRVGAVAVGETSVVIAVACGHRGDAFDACRFLIDTLKRDVPIWKKEIWANGVSSWVDPTAGGADR